MTDIAYDPGIAKAVRWNVDWTTGEIKKALAWKAEGVEIEEIAMRLDRSVGSVKGQFARLRKMGRKVSTRRVPLHGLDLSKTNYLVRRILKKAVREGFTNRTLAERAGISRTLIPTIVRGNPSFQTVVALAGAVGLYFILAEKGGGVLDDDEA